MTKNKKGKPSSSQQIFVLVFIVTGVAVGVTFGFLHDKYFPHGIMGWLTNRLPTLPTPPILQSPPSADGNSIGNALKCGGIFLFFAVKIFWELKSGVMWGRGHYERGKNPILFYISVVFDVLAVVTAGAGCLTFLWHYIQQP